jgi:hypothetical protein
MEHGFPLWLFTCHASCVEWLQIQILTNGPPSRQAMKWRQDYRLMFLIFSISHGCYFSRPHNFVGTEKFSFAI